MLESRSVAAAAFHYGAAWCAPAAAAAAAAAAHPIHRPEQALDRAYGTLTKLIRQSKEISDRKPKAKSLA